MVYQNKKGYDAVQASFDEYCFDDWEGVLEVWNGEIDERGWINIDAPLPDCQQDALIPIRVKGRITGKTEYGKLETLKNGKWVEYIPWFIMQSSFLSFRPNSMI